MFARLARKRGIEVGLVTAVAHVQLLEGLRPVVQPDGKILQEKQWAAQETRFPLQLVLGNLPVRPDGKLVAESTSVAAVYKAGVKFCFLGFPNYGTLGVVCSIDAVDALPTRCRLIV